MSLRRGGLTVTEVGGELRDSREWNRNGPETAAILAGSA